MQDIRAAKEAYDGLTEEEKGSFVGEEYREKLLDLWNFAERLGEMKTLDVIASGKRGCTWVLDGDGSLTISPTNGVSGTLNGLSSVDKAKVTKNCCRQ